jgi:hypothetical protein
MSKNVRENVHQFLDHDVQAWERDEWLKVIQEDYLKTSPATSTANPADINAEIDRLMGLLPVKARAEKIVGYAKGIVYSETMGIHTGLKDFTDRLEHEQAEAAMDKACKAVIAKMRAENEARKQWA